MSDRAQRVLDALIKFDANVGVGYPILSIRDFFDDATIESTDEDYEQLTIYEERQVIEAFLKYAY